MFQSGQKWWTDRLIDNAIHSFNGVKSDLCWKRFDSHFWSKSFGGNYPQNCIYLFSIIQQEGVTVQNIRWDRKALWLISWFWTMWIVYIIYLWPHLMTLCLVSSNKNFLESSLALHIGFLADSWPSFFVILFQVVWQKMPKPLVHVASMGLWLKMFGLIWQALLRWQRGNLNNWN